MTKHLLIGLSLTAPTLSCAPASPPAGEEARSTVSVSLSGSATPQAEKTTAGGGARVVLLGTGTPNADPDRSGPCVAIVVDGVPYLIDLGPGLVRRAEEARSKGVPGLAVENLARAFVTHLHTDHTLGYADLIFTPWVLGRSVPLEVYGPPGIAAMTKNLLAAYEQDIRIRLDGLEPANADGWKVNAHEITEGEIYRDPRVTVRAFRVRHGSWSDAFAFRFETADRSIVISGDTAPTDAVIRACQPRCDVLVHEVYSKDAFDRIPAEWQKYHASFHTSAVELAGLAAEARPGLLILYHQLFWGTTAAKLLGEVRAHYDGAVVSGEDLGIY